MTRWARRAGTQGSTKTATQQVTLRDDWRSHKLKLSIFILSFILDLLCSFIFYIAHDEQGISFFSGIVTHFNESASDVVVLSVARVIAIPVLVKLTVNNGSKEAQIKKMHDAKTKKKGLPLKSTSINDEDESGHTILMQDVEGEDVTGNSSSGGSGESISEEEEKRAITLSSRWQRIAIAVVIAGVTLCQIHTGVKCVVLKSIGSSKGQAVLLTSLVIWTNVELWLARFLIEVFTRESGQFFPELHPHPLYYTEDVPGHTCDMCKQRGLHVSHRCEACDFDMCGKCVKKNTKTATEGLIRTESGVKEEKELSNYQYMKQALAFARPHLWVISAAMILLLLSSACNLLLPNYQGNILDGVIKGDSSTFKKDIMMYLLANVMLGVFAAGRTLCFSLVGRKMLFDVQRILFDSVINQDIAYFDGTSTGDITSRINNDASAMISPANTVLSSLLSSVVVLVGSLFMCLYTSWRLSILAATTVGPITLIYRDYATWSKKINKEIYASMADANVVATETLENIRTVRSFGQEPKQKKKYEDTRLDALTKGLKDSWVNAGTTALTGYIDQAIGVLLLWYGGSVVMESGGEVLSVGNLITFQLYWNMINNSFNTLSGMVSSFTRAGGAASKVIGLIETKPDIDPTKGEMVPFIEGDISFKNVEFTYQMRPDQKILKGINFGRSGGGKSTIIHMMMRFYDPSAGGIYLDGKNLRDLNPTSFRSHVGIVSQETQLFNGTVEENIGFCVSDYTKEELYEAAKLANAHDFIMSFEEGYQTRVGERGMRLSGGQKQRIALARVFLKKPSLLFLDEATSALDTESEAQVQEAIDRLLQSQNCTVVLVAHRLSTVINAHKIAVVNNGEISEEGTHQELVNKGGIYARLVQRQVQNMQNSLEQSQPSSSLSSSQPNSDLVDSLLDDNNGTGSLAGGERGGKRGGRGGRGGGGRGGRGEDRPAAEDNDS